VTSPGEAGFGEASYSVNQLQLESQPVEMGHILCQAAAGVAIDRL